ncbi:uncharacterized protein LOC131941739 [Physella acuta]|uniref:uncharacterized protein LOC131941739 n=1 Tax=Physella acuta TaxID=109671 RepID=UPI0027DD660C|nr:uncharacterized protein LOC131941739 [Physella acuta]
MHLHLLNITNVTFLLNLFVNHFKFYFLIVEELPNHIVDLRKERGILEDEPNSIEESESQKKENCYTLRRRAMYFSTAGVSTIQDPSTFEGSPPMLLSPQMLDVTNRFVRVQQSICYLVANSDFYMHGDCKF